MSGLNPVWRKIVSRSREKDEKLRVTNTQFYYRMTPVTTLVLECGHRKVIRGDNVPATKVNCKDCREVTR